ncbi:16S rRNA (cytidine(1402)-2'-O)-methyltransferase [candidate division WOR-3 bacterium]|nr:16S rRNA (cytidine(1402)-2'-O)-methyltransferase [candidate division WOR-3 bacterium]
MKATLQQELPAGLYVVSTPIGNLGDITQRALEVLAKADVVACEDTRRTGLLLTHFGIKNRLVSYHEYNKLRRTPEIIKLLAEGKAVALVSDAGTPGISDPGFYLIREAIEQGFRIFPIPGASALLAALVISGLPSDRFAFEGFLPKRAGRRQKRLKALAREPRTMIFCESALRVKQLLEEMRALWGERKAVLCRELTKKFEEVIRGTLSEILEKIGTRELKGEVVVVVAGTGLRFDTIYEEPD